MGFSPDTSADSLSRLFTTASHHSDFDRTLPMQFGLIGAGCIGQLRAQALARIPGAKLVAVTEIDQQRAAQAAGPARARVCQDVAELVGLDQVEAVIVSTPPQFHEEAVLTALGVGKH